MYVITAQTRHSLRRAGAAAWVSSYITTNRSWRHHLCGRAGSQMSGERIQYVPDPTRGPAALCAQPVELWCSRKVQIDPHPGDRRARKTSCSALTVEFEFACRLALPLGGRGSLLYDYQKAIVVESSQSQMTKSGGSPRLRHTKRNVRSTKRHHARGGGARARSASTAETGRKACGRD